MTKKGDKNNYYAFCNANTEHIAKKAKIVEFLQENHNIYKRLSDFTFGLYIIHHGIYDGFDLKLLSEFLSLWLQKFPDDELKEKFVSHCFEKQFGDKPSKGLRAMGFVLVGMLQDSDELKKIEARKNGENKPES